MSTTFQGFPTIEAQYEQCRAWRDLLGAAGYEVCFMYTGEPEPFDREWQVWQGGKRIATIDIDGCGASWHGPDELWLAVIGPSVGVTD